MVFLSLGQNDAEKICFYLNIGEIRQNFTPKEQTAITISASATPRHTLRKHGIFIGALQSYCLVLDSHSAERPEFAFGF
jgi:hypothetical protein